MAMACVVTVLAREELVMLRAMTSWPRYLISSRPVHREALCDKTLWTRHLLQTMVADEVEVRNRMTVM